MSTVKSPAEPSAALAARLEQLASRSAKGATATTCSPPPPRPKASDSVRPAPAPVRRKRRHAAKKSRYAVLALSLLSTAGLAGTFAAIDGPAGSIVTASGGVVATATSTVVDGDVFTNKWGPVQVQATFAPDGSIQAVDALQVPFDDGKSVRINDRAVPTLNSEALSGQSATVDTVSGATYTSKDYERSLQSAIDTARAAGMTQLA